MNSLLSPPMIGFQGGDGEDIRGRPVETAIHSPSESFSQLRITAMRVSARVCASTVLALPFAIGVAPMRARAVQVGGLKIVVIEGEDAVNIIQQKTAVAPLIEVRDRNDLPVAGVPVTFSVAGPNATF